jgi:hypothetical protein
MADKDPADKVNLAGTLPVDQHNGLKPLLDELVDDPGTRRYAVCEFYAMSDKVSTDDGTHQVVVRWTRIEPVTGDTAKQVVALLDEAQSARTGVHRLPINDGEGEGDWRA